MLTPEMVHDINAHGHAQIFGWIGTFVIGIGYYSLSKMGGLMPVAVGNEAPSIT